MSSELKEFSGNTIFKALTEGIYNITIIIDDLDGLKTAQTMYITVENEKTTQNLSYFALGIFILILFG